MHPSFERHSPKIMVTFFRRIVRIRYRRYATHADASRSSGSPVWKLRFSAPPSFFSPQIPRDTECRHTGTFGRKCYRPRTDLHDMIIFLDIAGGKGGGGRNDTGRRHASHPEYVHPGRTYIAMCIRACERCNGGHNRGLC